MAAITVATTATAILDGTGTDNPHNAGGQVLIYHNGTEDVFIGTDADVTTSTGVPVSAGSTVGMEVGAGRAVYGIVAAGTEEVRVEVF